MDAILPPEFQPLLDVLADTPESVKAMWRYAIVLAMIDDEKARVTGKRIQDSRMFLSIRTVAGDEIEIERPAMSEETERMLLEQIRETTAVDQFANRSYSRRGDLPLKAVPLLMLA